MRKFNIESVKAGAKVVTRAGKKVNLTYFMDATNINIAGVIDGTLLTWFESGRFSAIEGNETEFDLFLTDEYVVVINKEGYRLVWDEIFESEEDAQRWIDLRGEKNAVIHKLAFKDGYIEAREKYKYTEEDIRKAIAFGGTKVAMKESLNSSDADDFIQSLHQYPTEFECETESYHYVSGGLVSQDIIGDSGLTHHVGKTIKTTTINGRRTWVGKYK
jgi:hypothetical protein